MVNELKAEVRTAPIYSGDGYGWGGGTVLTIGQFAIPFGEHPEAGQLAQDLATAWNTRADTARLSELEAEVAQLRNALGKFTKARLLKGVDGCDGWALSILADAYQEARAALEAQS